MGSKGKMGTSRVVQGTQVQALVPLKINKGKLRKYWQGTFPLIFFFLLLIKSYL